MHILITYDVSTETSFGGRRLRMVAQTCKNFGQRVQKSVFECTVNPMQYEELVRKLSDIIEAKEDSLRIYRLPEPKDKYIKSFGINKTIDFDGPLLA